MLSISVNRRLFAVFFDEKRGDTESGYSGY
jgi:hypothetical protein